MVTYHQAVFSQVNVNVKEKGGLTSFELFESQRDLFATKAICFYFGSVWH